MEPKISLTLKNARRAFYPGDELEGQYQVEATSTAEVTAIELSVLWYTEGKGDEDLAVHFFQRLTEADVEGGDFRNPHRFRTVLPNSPLSYSGVSLRIRWCVRLRVFLARGKQLHFQVPFVLGESLEAAAVSQPRSLQPSHSVLADSQANEEDDDSN